MPPADSSHRQRLQQRSDELLEKLLELIEREEPLSVAAAPPGSGKTWLLLRAIHHAFRRGERVAVATQTNAQADDVCRRLRTEFPAVPITRFIGQGGIPDVPGDVTVEGKAARLPSGKCVVVGTTAKWGLVNLPQPFDVLLVDEAWQMAWSDFMLLGQVAERFVLIGDPGQIAPVVTIRTQRWETSPRAPHVAAPDVILADPTLAAERLQLPASRRLPHDTVELIRPFYDFEFDAWAQPGERSVRPTRGGNEPFDGAIDLLEEGTVAALAIPTPESGPPLECDDEVAAVAAGLAARLIDRRCLANAGEGEFAVEPAHIGITATHRVLLTAIQQALPSTLRSHVRVDTPERWQGLERPVMIAVHPLSGVVRPSGFDLDTGRLCVMASRHKAGLIVVARDHLSATLDEFIPCADQAVGRPDITGRGYERHLAFWGSLERDGRIAHAVAR
ncbi:AAA family ATPase [Gemmatimonas sp.]|uniref:AAA family ATPase n=1 Tax=Gemmatimonas sp. TaxID=1962908 RepID=UPI0025BBDBCB|nr:AAA family ATPase [Gemmatimonas sp.]MCA2992382.1 AAA family ATPase [Gemmatimonas sp.]